MGDVLLQDLAQAVKDEPTRDKILLVPRMSDGVHVLDRLALSGVNWLNVRPATAGTLASTLAQLGLARRGLAEAGDVTTLLLVEEALAALGGGAAPHAPLGNLNGGAAAQGGGYFGRTPRTPGLIQALHSAVQELRLAGIGAADLGEADFVDPQKGREFIALLRAYEQGLADRKLADRADVLRLALDAARRGATVLLGSDSLYLVPDNLPLRGLERQLLTSLSAGHRFELRRAAVIGLDPPALYRAISPDTPGAAERAETPPSALSFLFAPARRPPDEAASQTHLVSDPLTLFHATSTYNEVREVFRRILSAGTAFDQVHLTCTDTAGYTRIIDGVARKLGVPCTFAEGVSVLTTRPGRALTALLRWLGNDCRADALWRALAAGDLGVGDIGTGDEDAPSGTSLGRALRALGVGWGRERYLPAVEQALKALDVAGEAMDLAGEEEGRDSGSLAARRRRLLALKAWLTGLLDLLPTPDDQGNVDVAALAAGLAKAVEQYASVNADDDAAARDALRSQLNEVAATGAGQLSLSDAVQRLESVTTGLTVRASGPKPGYVHVSDYRAGAFVGRPHLFVLGLDEVRFPGAGLQDPVLLDEERARISDDLPLSTDRLRQNVYALALLLANAPGQVTLSFASYDPVEDRGVFPSAVILQAYRLQQGKPDADYSELLRALGMPVGYGPSRATQGLAAKTAAPIPLDATDWWLGRLTDGDRLLRGEEAVRQAHPRLNQGLIAAEQRESDALTPYDGQIEPDPQTLDPRQNPDLVLSPTAIEKLGVCPQAYFLRHVLHVKPPEDLEYDPFRWLDPLMRGSLLHDVFHRFLKGLADRGQGRPTARDRDALLKLTEEAIESLKAQVPPPGEQVYEIEKRDLLRSAELFFRLETDPEALGTPRHFELAFGTDGDGAGANPGDPGAGEVGPTEPVAIDLGLGRSFRLRGRVDRVDELQPHRYQVWDYKTGSAHNYDEHKYLNRGRQVQHALYALAVEQILRDSGVDPQAEVVSAGYLFPTEKGEGRRVNHQQNRPKEVRAVLGDLFDLVAAGTFVAAEDGHGCGICDYQEVCGAKAAAQRINRKLKAGDPRLAPLGRLKENG